MNICKSLTDQIPFPLLMSFRAGISLFMIYVCISEQDISLFMIYVCHGRQIPGHDLYTSGQIDPWSLDYGLCMAYRIMLPGWERYGLHDLANVSSVGFVQHRSCTPYHSDTYMINRIHRAYMICMIYRRYVPSRADRSPWSICMICMACRSCCRVGALSSE